MNCLFCSNEMELCNDSPDQFLYSKKFKCQSCNSFGVEYINKENKFLFENNSFQYFYYDKFTLKFRNKKLYIFHIEDGTLLVLDKYFDINPSNVSTRLKNILLLS